MNESIDLQELIEKRIDALTCETMKELVLLGDAIDLSMNEKTKGGEYILEEYDEHKSYVDCFWQTWITYIGLLKTPRWERQENGTIRILPKGTILATWDENFDDTDFETLYEKGLR